MWAKVKNNEILWEGKKLPKSLYDPITDKHIKLDTEARREQFGYYRVKEPTITDVSKVKGSKKYFDSVNKVVTWTVVDRDYSDYTDDISGETIKQIDNYKVQKLNELDALEAELWNLAIGFIVRKNVLNDNWSAAERKNFQDVYDDIGTWRAEVNAETDAKTAHLKTFDASTHRQKLKNMK